MNRLLAERSRDGKSVLGSMANMFGLTDANITELPIERLLENANHPFKVREGEALTALAESIKADGLVQPIIVRPINSGYEILSGHRRTRASKMLGKISVKAIVVNADDEEADRILIDTNFRQRDVLLPSEIARSYKLRYEDLKKSRQNSDGRNFRKIDEILAEEFHCSKSSIYMYLHFLDLREELLELLDSKKLKMKIAEELSYLSHEEQGHVYELVFRQKFCTLDIKNAARLKDAHENGPLGKADVMGILAEKPASVRTGRYFAKGELDRYRGKFASAEAMEKAIITFLEHYESG